MKKFTFVFIALLFLVCCNTQVFSHSGRTDSYGGHFDRSTGEYHYHHGYPAHQHKNGKCPYNFDDETNSSSSKSSSALSRITFGLWIKVFFYSNIILFWWYLPLGLFMGAKMTEKFALSNKATNILTIVIIIIISALIPTLLLLLGCFSSRFF